MSAAFWNQVENWHKLIDCLTNLKINMDVEVKLAIQVETHEWPSKRVWNAG